MLGAIDDVIDELPVKVVNLRDLILLKLWAAPERPEMAKRTQDETDVIGLIEYNSGKVSAEDIAYICRALLATAYTPEDVKKYRAQIEWLNGVLEKLGLSDRRYDLQQALTAPRPLPHEATGWATGQPVAVARGAPAPSIRPSARQGSG